MSNQTTNILKDFKKRFLIERITKIHISDETEMTYLAKPEDLKGSVAQEALLSFLETVISQVREETERRTAQKIYDKWNNSLDSKISFGDWLKNYLLIKSQAKDSSKS